MKDGSNIRSSILDRLVDMEPGVPGEPARNRLVDIWRIKVMVVRDIENLLNTRRQILSVPAAYGEVNNSVFMYGLGDFTSENPRSPSVRQRLRRDIEKAISRFEPRLKNVTVHMEEDMAKGRNLRFRITGMLVVESEAEPVSFDSYFDNNRGEYVIEE
jgi:type VI secretion system protein ImpF